MTLLAKPFNYQLFSGSGTNGLPVSTDPSPKIGGVDNCLLVCSVPAALSCQVELWGWLAITGAWAYIADFGLEVVTQNAAYSADLTQFDSVYAYVHDFVGTGTVTVRLQSR